MSGGLITTRAASESHLGEEVAVAVARAVAAAGRRRRRAASLLALIPGLPKFVVPHRGAACSAPPRTPNRKRRATAPVDDAAPAAPASDAPDDVAAVDPLSVEVGYALVALVDEKQGGTLLTRVRAIRRQIATETGLVVPPVHVADNLQLGPRDLRDPRQGRRSRARRAVCRSPAGDQSRHGDAARSTARRRASRRSACRRCWIASEQRDARVGRRLHGRRSDDGALDAPVGDRSARSCRTC